MNGVMNNSSLQDAQLRLQGFQDFVNDHNVADGTDVRLANGDAGGITQEQSASWHDRTWHSGRADVRRSIDRNNAVRQNFLDALIEVYGEGNKSRGFWCLPEYIRKALKGTWACGQAGDFKLVADDSAAHGFRVTSGRPLSARRIRAVFRAIAREEIRKGQTNSAQGVKNKNSAQGVANVGGKWTFENFQTAFNKYCDDYDFGLPLAGKSANSKDAQFDSPQDADVGFLNFSPRVHSLILKGIIKDLRRDVSDSERRNGQFYRQIKEEYCEKFTSAGAWDPKKEGDSDKIGAKVLYDFIVAFNKDNPGFAITIPQEEIEEQSQQQV